MQRDLLSAYVLTGARVASWIIITALVFRLLGREAFALLALLRATVGLLNYTSLGLAAAVIQRSAQHVHQPSQTSRIYASAWVVALVGLALGGLILAIYLLGLPVLHRLPAQTWLPAARQLLLALGVGVLLRLASDAPAAMLQTRGRISLDNLMAAGAELSWPVMAAVALYLKAELPLVGWTFAAAGGLLLLARHGAVRILLAEPGFRWQAVDRRLALGLLQTGVLVATAQLADFLYAPTDYILINWLIDPAAVAIYAPAIQIDAALLLSVGAIAAVLLPRSALAHAASDVSLLRRYYLRGTLGSLGILVLASGVTWLIAPVLLRRWLGSDLPATRQILPLVLIHSVVGGSSAVGRSILLGMGQAKALTIAALASGLANVLLSLVFVAAFGWGLQGIVLGTILAVSGRCLAWMPWYVLRCLRGRIDSAAAGPTEPPIAQTIG